MATWIALMGSPRSDGNSARACRDFADWVAFSKPDVDLRVFDVSDMDFEACIGCDICREGYECFRNDDADEMLSVLADAEKLFVFTPVYFAGLPGTFKGLVDRFQPLFWKRLDLKAEGGDLPAKRRAAIVLFGDGDDPHGYEPAVASMRSAFALADFAIEEVQPCIGGATQPDFTALVGG